MRSPHVKITEQDRSQRIPEVSTSIGALPVISNKGEINEVVEITSIDDYINTFGKPDDNVLVYNSYFSAAGYLEWGNSLRAVRIEGDNARGASFFTDTNGVTGTSGITPDQYPLEENEIVGDESPNVKLYFIAIGPGSFYNDVSVSIIDQQDYEELQNFDLALNNTYSYPHKKAVAEQYWKGTTQPVTADGFVFGVEETGPDGTISPSGDLSDAGFGDETSETGFQLRSDVINLIEEDEFSPKEEVLSEYIGLDNKPLTSEQFILHVFNENDVIVESYLCSTNPEDKNNRNENLFCSDVVNETSDYIQVFADQESDIESVGQAYLRDGQNDHGTEDSPNEPTGNIVTQLDSVFGNYEEIDIDLLIDPDMSDAVKREMDEICSDRMDCFTILSMPEYVLNDVRDMKEYVEDDLGINSSYSAIYGNYFKKYDTFNDQYRWVPVAGDVAGLFVRTDDIYAPWWGVAGQKRGLFNDIADIKINPEKSGRDILYSNRINPIIDFPDRGVMIYGQKTLKNEASAFDRINVRRLFIVVESAIRRFARSFLFELNNERTRTRFYSQVSSYLSKIKGRRGLYDYEVVADDTINTETVIDSNEFKADIYLKPTRAIEFIQLNFIAADTGIEFDEIVT